jgi:hypothetical protein
VFWVRPPAWRLSPQQRTCRRASEAWPPRSTRGEEAAGGGSHDGREKRELSSSTTSRPPWKVAREVRGPVANGKPGYGPRAFDPLTFHHGERPVGRGNCPENSWASRPRGFESLALLSRRQSQLATTPGSQPGGRGQNPVAVPMRGSSTGRAPGRYPGGWGFEALSRSQDAWAGRQGTWLQTTSHSVRLRDASPCGTGVDRRTAGFQPAGVGAVPTSRSIEGP